MRLLIELKVFRERLRELAYIEGQNITIEPRYWGEKSSSFQTLSPN
jgi:hypothetical protein